MQSLVFFCVYDEDEPEEILRFPGARRGWSCWLSSRRTGSPFPSWPEVFRPECEARQTFRLGSPSVGNFSSKKRIRQVQFLFFNDIYLFIFQKILISNNAPLVSPS
jgi:hypothetical protein